MADKAITGLNAEPTPSRADLMEIVDDVVGTPTSKKAELGDVLDLNNPQTSAHASPPSSPYEGQMWLPNNSFYIYRYSGSLWVPWGPISPMTPPDDSLFSWENQGGASVALTNGGIFLSAPDGGGGVECRIRKMTAPSPPYTWTVAFKTNNVIMDFRLVGLLFRQSSDGKLHTMHLRMAASAPHVELYSLNWASANTPNTTYAQQHIYPRETYWFQISDDSTNRICRISSDGQNWIPFHTVGRTNYMTANQLGFFVDARNAANAFNTGDMTILSSKIT